jgi:hypothetical protein
MDVEEWGCVVGWGEEWGWHGPGLCSGVRNGVGMVRECECAALA